MQDDFRNWLVADIKDMKNIPYIVMIQREEWRFEEAFFDRTIKKQSPTAKIKKISIDELLKTYSSLPEPNVAGTIFHTSKCGSTLACQLLGQYPNHLVLSEPPVFKIFRCKNLPIETKFQISSAVVKSYFFSMRGLEKSLFIKYGPGISILMDWQRIYLPKTPWIFMFRNPSEIINSYDVKFSKLIAARLNVVMNDALDLIPEMPAFFDYKDVDLLPHFLTAAFGLKKSTEFENLLSKRLKIYSKDNSLLWDEKKVATPIKISASQDLLEKYNTLSDYANKSLAKFHQQEEIST